MRRLMLDYIFFAAMVISLLVYCKTEDITYGNDELCPAETFDDRGARCGAPPGTYPNYADWVPSNVTEFERFCSIANNYFPCFLKWDFKCDENMRSHLGAFLDACRADSALHEGLKENMKCIHKFYEFLRYRKIPCIRRNKELSKIYEKFEKTEKVDLFPELSEDDSYVIGILIPLFDGLGCFLSHLKCPKVAEDSIMEVYVKIHNIIHVDLPRLKDKIFEVMDHLPVDDVRKRLVKDTIEKYENKCEEVNCADYENNLRKLYFE